MKKAIVAGLCVALIAAVAAAQTTYQPKYKGDPARSDSEFLAIAYMKTFLRAQHLYKKKKWSFRYFAHGAHEDRILYTTHGQP